MSDRGQEKEVIIVCYVSPKWFCVSFLQCFSFISRSLFLCVVSLLESPHPTLVCLQLINFPYSLGSGLVDNSFLLLLRQILLYPLTTVASQPQSLVTPSPMAQLLEQLALDDLPPTAPSKDFLDSCTKAFTEEPESLVSSPPRVDSPSLLTDSRDSSLTTESVASGSSREGSYTIPAGPSQNSSSTSLHKTIETPPTVPQHDPINNHPHSLHLSASSPTLRRGTSILRSSSSTDQSTIVFSNPPSPPPTSPPTPSVKFAPLPEIERPRKRRHSQRLGVAARSQLLARRRQVMRENEDVDRPPKQFWRSDEEEEDPLVALGHMVKLASIGIWRKVSLRDKKTRPVMQGRSNSDSVLEIARPVTYSDAGDQVFVELVDEDTGDDKQTTKTKTTDEEPVVVQTQATATVSIPTEE